MTEANVSFNAFLPMLAASLRGKNKNDKMLSEGEFVGVMKVVYLQALIEFCRDSGSLTEEVPVDTYEQVLDYPVVAPKGFIVHRVVQIKDGVLQAPRTVEVNNEHVTLAHCPTKDVLQAFWLELALVPSRTNPDCELPHAFIDENFDALLALMFHHAYLMERRAWADLGRADRYRREYRRALNQSKRRKLGANGPIKLKSRRLSG